MLLDDRAGRRVVRRHQHRHHGQIVGDEIVLNGRKWWSTGALRPECAISIVMAVTDPGADRHAQHSMVLVPLDTPGLTVERSTTVFGYDDGPHGGHGVIHYDDVRVPIANLLGPRGGGFAMAQARLGPGRIHHCMRTLGMAERALELMCERAPARTAFGQPLARQGVVRERIAESRIRVEQARLLTLKTAWLIDTVAQRRPASRSPPSRSRRRGASGSWTRPSRCTAVPASPTTPRWPRCGRRCAPCGWPMAPTRCTCGSIARGNSGPPEVRARSAG